MFLQIEPCKPNSFNTITFSSVPLNFVQPIVSDPKLGYEVPALPFNRAASANQDVTIIFRAKSSKSGHHVGFTSKSLAAERKTWEFRVKPSK